MSNASQSINDFINQIVDDTATEGITMEELKNGSVDMYNYEFSNKLFASKKAIDVWYKDFKPKWNALKKLYKNTYDSKDQLRVLMEQKKLILQCRNIIVTIPESALLSIGFFLVVITVTIELYLSSVVFADTYHMLCDTELGYLFPGMHHVSPKTVHVDIPNNLKNASIISSIIATVYAVLKVYARLTKFPADVVEATGKSYTNVATKAICINKLNKYLTITDQNIQKVSKGSVGTVDENAMKRYDALSEKILAKAETYYDSAAKSLKA